jgi:chromosome partitioning protein
MKIWAVANQKGGVGKTTTTVALGGLLAQRGERVLLVDLDPHGSLTVYFRYNPDELEDSAFSLFEDGPSTLAIMSILQPTGYDNLTLLPSSTALATLERRFGAQ